MVGKQNITEIFFFQNHAENETWRLFPDFFLVFKNAFYEVKASGEHLCFKIFCSPQLGYTHTKKKKNCREVWTVDTL